MALAGKARGLPGVYVALFKKIDEMGGIHPGYTRCWATPSTTGSCSRC